MESVISPLVFTTSQDKSGLLKMKLTNFTFEELHSLLIGFFEVLCPWPARYRIAKQQWDEVLEEYHYYLGGRALGFVTLVWVILGAAYFVEEVLF